jgi:hypothetical protein
MSVQGGQIAEGKLWYSELGTYCVSIQNKHSSASAAGIYHAQLEVCQY